MPVFHLYGHHCIRTDFHPRKFLLLSTRVFSQIYTRIMVQTSIVGALSLQELVMSLATDLKSFHLASQNIITCYMNTLVSTYARAAKRMGVILIFGGLFLPVTKLDIGSRLFLPKCRKIIIYCTIFWPAIPSKTAPQSPQSSIQCESGFD